MHSSYPWVLVRAYLGAVFYLIWERQTNVLREISKVLNGLIDRKDSEGSRGEVRVWI
jgi:hypothetical protein